MQTYEQSFVMIKHDGIQRNLVGEIISRFERAGLKIVGLKMIVADRKRAIEHYGKDDIWCESKGTKMIDTIIKNGGTADKSAVEYGRGIVNTLIDYITAGPVVQMVLEGNHAVAIVKKLVGGTEPLSSDVGTIRGDYTIDSYELSNVLGRATRNLVHCTGESHEAEFEVNLWFTKEELQAFKHVNEALLKDIGFDNKM